MVRKEAGGHVREREKREEDGRRDVAEKKRERVSGSLQLCEHIKQSSLCQGLNTPAEDS